MTALPCLCIHAKQASAVECAWLASEKTRTCARTRAHWLLTFVAGAGQGRTKCCSSTFFVASAGHWHDVLCPLLHARTNTHLLPAIFWWQVPAKGMMFFADALPKTATGKIQRRFMVEHFITKKGEHNLKLNVWKFDLDSA